jgi:hypothetical protein
MTYYVVVELILFPAKQSPPRDCFAAGALSAASTIPSRKPDADQAIFSPSPGDVNPPIPTGPENQQFVEQASSPSL